MNNLFRAEFDEFKDRPNQLYTINKYLTKIVPDQLYNIIDTTTCAKIKMINKIIKPNVIVSVLKFVLILMLPANILFYNWLKFDCHQFYENLLIYGAVVLVVSIYIIPYFRKREHKNVLDKIAVEQVITSFRYEIHEVLEYLDIPFGVQRIDILIQYSNLKKRRLANNHVYCELQPMYIFEKKGCICFSNLYQLWEVPINKCKKIVEINDEENQDFYKYLKIHRRNEQISDPVRFYYKMMIGDDEDTFEIYVPNYEIDKITGIIGKENISIL